MAGPIERTPVIYLTPGDIGWIIDVRCMRKTKLTPYENAKGKGVKQNYDFQDDTAKVLACAFNDVAKMLNRLIEPGKRFEISKAAVNKLFSKPVTGYHNVELMLFSHSAVLFLKDDYDFVQPIIKYDRLKDVEMGTLIANSSIIGPLEQKEFENADKTIRKTEFLEICVQEVQPHPAAQALRASTTIDSPFAFCNCKV